MGRVLLVCWVLSLAGVAWLRFRRSGRLQLETLRTDVMAAFGVGTFLWLIWIVRF
ncbi:MAG: hypothetical protein OEV40_14255 [Acidimicrobiia bacterium]|nr:hypothetical protein [Acidimicrobiia bacterium]